MSLLWQAYRLYATLFYLRKFRSTVPRRIISLTLLIVLACGVVGFPIASPLPEKNGRFPCEDCLCGCATADFCWDKCCCHTDTEKLQWALENNVQPPEFLLTRVTVPTGSIASMAPETICCACSKSTRQCQGEPPTSNTSKSCEDDEWTPFRWVVLEDAARCHGVDWIWSLLSSVTVEHLAPVVGVPKAPFLFWIPLVNQHAESAIECPDPPVP